MNELVKYLARGNHPVEISVRPEKTIRLLKECIDRGFVHVKFTDTKGGTELGVSLDRAATDLSTANFDEGSGSAKFVGSLRLNYVKVRCIAQIDLGSFRGYGHLEPLDEAPA